MSQPNKPPQTAFNCDFEAPEDIRLNSTVVFLTRKDQ